MSVWAGSLKDRGRFDPDPSTRLLKIGSMALSCACATALTLSLVGTAGPATSGLGVPHYWSWLLTGLQVLSLWGAGRRRWWGWPLGASVQPPWIAYAVLTGQFGFIPGCAVSAIVQTYSFVRAGSELGRNQLTAGSRAE